MKKTLFRAETRGFANHGWLKTYHNFSFANYYDPERMRFGALRVLNDDLVEPGMGFGTHPHDNMEIISIPLEGIMAHKDSQGNEFTLKPGDIQVMSAGAGLTHSEYNYSKDKKLAFLQIWVYPSVNNTQPSYEEKTFVYPDNEMVLIVSPDREGESLPIKQNAYFYIGKYTGGMQIEYMRKMASNGVFIFTINGKLSVAHEMLHRRDAIGIEDADDIGLQFEEDSHILLIDIPM